VIPLSRREFQRRTTLRWAALISIALHAMALAFLLLTVHRHGKDAGQTQPMVELVMLEQQGQGQTTGKAPPVPDQTSKTPPMAPSVPSPPTPPPTPPVARPPAPPVPTPSPAPPPPQQPDQTVTLLLPPPPPPPPQPQPPQAPPPTPTPPRPPTPMMAAAPPAPAPPAPQANEAPHINLGGTDSLSNVLVRGTQVIPAGPDTKVHNKEPIYPLEAARRGEQGLVILLVHVAPDGTVAGIDIAQSSGFSLLDHAARDAVATWKFVPAVRNGQPIPSSIPLRIMFDLD
jgi:periplasmic protein TonB